jgi:hypothetical protein
MKELELWSDIEGYEGHYQVSNLGRVRSLDRGMYVRQDRYNQPRWTNRKGRILKPGIDGKGYPMVRLCSFGTVKQIMVHRLVALHFVPNPENKPVVNHIDFDPMNSRADNLEWCSIRENNLHSIHRKPSIIKSFFNEQDRATLNELFDAGIGVSAIAYQLNLPYNSVRYVYKLRNNP